MSFAACGRTILKVDLRDRDSGLFERLHHDHLHRNGALTGNGCDRIACRKSHTQI